MVSEAKNRNQQRGMTLLELLVVMTLLALVSSLLMQGFSSALSTYERVQRKQSEGMPLELGYRWLSDTIAGVQAELDPPRQFKGDAHSLRGITQRPLLGMSGQVNAFSWQLNNSPDGQLQLIYSQPDQVQWLMASWPPGSQGKFIYRSLQGAPIDHWPYAPEQTTPPIDGRIPRTILLEVTPSNAPPLRWYFNLPGRTFPRVDYRDI
jgi:general secretion pathway protein J